MNTTTASERIHIGIFGKRNAGKSSLINALTNQNLAIVSDIKGTTTDPVYKAMELLPLGPVMIIDTPGIDDEGTLGKLRIQKTLQILNKTDIAIVVIDSCLGLTDEDNELIKLIKNKNIPFIIVFTKKELANIDADSFNAEHPHMFVDSQSGFNINLLRKTLATLIPEHESKALVSDLVNPGDFVILVIPIDKAAPKNRLILPQQQVIRELLEHGAYSVISCPENLTNTINALNKKPTLVITDSQVFAQVAPQIPQDIALTSFSILFARYKGNLKLAVQGANMLSSVKDSDKILISEGCTHHRQCGDIGTVKLPALIKKFSGSNPIFEWTSGTEFPTDLSAYKLIIHCGGCMLNEREMQYRTKCAEEQGVPITNYGIAIAHMNGILQRTLSPFKDM